MKTKVLITLASLLFMAYSGFSQESKQQKKDSKYESISVQTSAVCGDCKKRLEHEISFEKGVKSVELDNETKVLTIKFKKGKNTKEDLKKAITKVGYDADEMLADQKAHDALPKCCQKGNKPH